MKRDKGNLFRNDNTLPSKLEEELDNIVRGINDIGKSSGDRILKVEKDIQELIKATKTNSSVTSGGVSGNARINISSHLEQMYIGAVLVPILKPFDYTNTSLLLTSLQAGDFLELITEITETPDTGVTVFTINDGTNDLLTLSDVDLSITSVNTPPKTCCLLFSSAADLTLTITGGTTLTGRIFMKILRRPMVAI